LNERGLAWAETCAFDQRLGLFGLEADVQLQVVDVTIELFGSVSNFMVRIPFQETGVCCNTLSIHERCWMLSHSLFKPRNFLKSLSEQTPHARLASIPMISWRRMTAGVPRAPKLAARWEVLEQYVNSIAR
jgi:hypothetical protein